MLRAKGLGKRFGEKWLFRGVEFELQGGDRLVVLGKNGAGKSTLVRMLCGLEPPTEGSVEAEGSISLAAADQALYPNLTCAEHLELAASLRGVNVDAEILADFELLAQRDQRAGDLSTGQRSRLKLALALQNQPDVLLLDEPSANLDDAGRGIVERVVLEQSKAGAVVIATNDPQERRFATLELDLS